MATDSPFGPIEIYWWTEEATVAEGGRFFRCRVVAHTPGGDRVLLNFFQWWAPRTVAAPSKDLDQAWRTLVTLDARAGAALRKRMLSPRRRP